jgi:hypothetical protein
MWMGDVADFILYIFEQQNEERVWDLWLATDKAESFADFRKDKVQTVRQKKRGFKPQATKESTEEMLKFASQFIKVRGEE